MIDFGEAVRRYYSQYLVAEGRSQRSAYWWVVLYQIIIYLVLITVLLMSDGGLDLVQEIGDLVGGAPDATTDFDLNLGVSGIVALALMVIFALINILPDIMLKIRRFHDLGQTGWMVLGFMIFGMIPAVGIVFDLANLVWFMLRGTVGPNVYGPDPLGSDPNVFS